jgi:hypothetical protein
MGDQSQKPAFARQTYASLGLMGDNEEISKESPHIAPSRLAARARLTCRRRPMTYVDEQRLQEATKTQTQNSIPIPDSMVNS